MFTQSITTIIVVGIIAVTLITLAVLFLNHRFYMRWLDTMKELDAERLEQLLFFKRQRSFRWMLLVSFVLIGLGVIMFILGLFQGFMVPEHYLHLGFMIVPLVFGLILISWTLFINRKR